MNIALIQCPMFNPRMPQIGPAYLKSVLEKRGNNVLQFDFNISLYNKVNDIEKRNWDYKSESFWTQNTLEHEWEDERTIRNINFLGGKVLDLWAKSILNTTPDLIGFTVYNTSVNVSVLLAKKIKEFSKNAKIIFGGPFIIENVNIFDGAINPGVRIKNIMRIIDIVVVGEGEDVFPEIVERVNSGKSLKGCEGIIAKEGYSLLINKVRPLSKNIDKLPYPDFSGYSLNAYTDLKFLPILTSRGCINHCAFCNDPYFFNYVFRKRSPESVVEEMNVQRNNYQVEFFHFNDELINADLDSLLRMCKLIIKNNIITRWGASISVRLDMNRKLFEQMRQSGCEYLNFGIESASNDVLRSMKKPFTVDAARQNIVDAYSSGIAVFTNWIVGFPTETIKDFEKTLHFIENNRRYISGLDSSVFTIKPHSYIHNNLNLYNIQSNNIYDWQTQDLSNNYGERLRRMDIFWEKCGRKFYTNRVGGYLDSKGMSDINKKITQKILANEGYKKQKISIKKRALEFLFDQGKGRIFYNGVELTKHFGLYTSVFSLGHWIDSLQASWKVRCVNDTIIAKGEYTRFPMCQVWKVKLNDPHCLIIEISMFLEQRIQIDRYDTNLMLSDKYQLLDIDGLTSKLSNKFNDSWVELVRFSQGKLKTQRNRLMRVIKGFPSVVFEPDKLLVASDLLAIHNTNKQLQARGIIYRKSFSDDDNIFSKGRYRYYSGKIKVFY